MTSSVPSPVLMAADCAADPRAGGKARNLALIADVVSVPDFVVVPSDWFGAALGDGAGLIAMALDRLRASGSSGLPVAHRTIAGVLGELRLPQDRAAELRTAVPDRLGTSGTFAVRSSAITEDSGVSSEAGLYDSFLHVTEEGLEEAVLACWRSYYSAGALAHRLARGGHWAPPDMAVVVQRMVAAARAGVAFSKGPGAVLVESVEGLADALVAGRVSGARSTVVAGSRSGGDAWRQPVAEAVLRVRGKFETEVDAEWVWDGHEVHVVQARAVTAELGASVPDAQRVDEPVLRTRGVYSDEVTGGFEDLGAVQRVYENYRRKRSPLQQLAARHGCAAGLALAVQLNGRGVRTPAWPELLAGFGEKVVLDASDELRQIIVGPDEVTETLDGLLSLTADPSTVHTVVMREFISGTCGALSQVTGGALHVEYSRAGLLAMNRGLVPSNHVTLSPDGGVLGEVPQDWTPATLTSMREVTEAFTRTQPAAVIEWAVRDGRPFAIDYSRVGAQLGDPGAGHDVSVLSRGAGGGPALVVGPELREQLEAASIAPVISVSEPIPNGAEIHIADLHRKVLTSPEPPVVVADSPYAILAVLIGSVAGFVFRSQASLLCHLTILLREHGVPALAAPGFEVRDGEVVRLLDDGTIRVGDAA